MIFEVRFALRVVRAKRQGLWDYYHVWVGWEFWCQAWLFFSAARMRCRLAG